MGGKEAGDGAGAMGTVVAGVAGLGRTWKSGECKQVNLMLIWHMWKGLPTVCEKKNNNFVSL